MLINLTLALVFIVFAVSFLLSFGILFQGLSSMVKRLTRFMFNAKVLAEYILRAYIRYRRAINKPSY